MFSLSLEEPAMKKTGFILLILFCSAIFISKSAVNLIGALLLPLSLFYLFRYRPKNVLQHRYFLILLLPMLLGLMTTPFSDLGVKGIVPFLREYRFCFLIIPVAAFACQNKEFEIIGFVLNISALASVGYVFARHWTGVQPDHDFTSFHTIGRHADLLFSIAIVNISGIIHYKFEHKNLIIKTVLALNTTLLLYNILGLRIVGAWVGFIAGIFAILFLYNKKLLVLFILIGLLAWSYMPNFVKNNVTKTADYKNYYSSKARWQLNRSGLDFLLDRGLFFSGTGTKHAKQSYIQFMKEQPVQYQEKYSIAYHDFPGNFHNSFLQMAVEAGLLFAMAYFGAIVYLIIQMLKKKKQMPPNDQAVILGSIALLFGFFVSQLFHGGLFGYAGLVSILTLYNGIVVTARYPAPLL